MLKRHQLARYSSSLLIFLQFLTGGLTLGALEEVLLGVGSAEGDGHCGQKQARPQQVASHGALLKRHKAKSANVGLFEVNIK